MQQIICLLLLFFPVALFAEDSFSVSLDTEVPLEPIYISSLEGGDPNYAKNLFKVLEYDLNHNGMTAVLSRNNDRISLEASEKGKESLNWTGWGTQKALYVVKWTLDTKSIHVYLYWLKGKKAKKTDLPITGKLAQDRQAVHQLADWIFKNLYGKEGVASSTILYTVREPNKDPTFKSEYLSEVWECDSDGKNARQVTHEKRYIVTPCYIPAGPGHRPGSFLFVSYKLGQPKIYRGSLKDGSSTQLITLRGNQFMPTISHDRGSLAFVSDAMGNPDLFLLPYDEEAGPGKPRQIFASPRGTQGSPAFSPDSKKIAFVSNKDGSPRIYLMDVPPPSQQLKDMKPRLISRSCRENTSPSWSPNGRYIAYAGMTSGVRQIWVYDLEEDKEEQLTFSAGHKENPSWAKNSFHLVFNSDQGGSKAQLFVVNLNQRDPVAITEGNSDKRFPCYEPLVK